MTRRWRPLVAHARLGSLELLRQPAFSVPTLAFPAIFFLFFAAPRDGDDADVLLASYAAFAVLGVAFFQFGVGIAAERSSPWEGFVRVLPVTVRVRLAARVLSALVFAAASVTLLLATATATTSFALSPARWPAFAAALLLGAVPFALLGIALGYWTSPRAALPVANLVFLPLSFAGGLWGGAARLPDVLAAVSPFLPTRQWGEVVWWAVGEGSLAPWAPAGLAASTAVFAALAVWGYRRDEGERYS